MPRSTLDQVPCALDAYEAEVVEKSVFGMTTSERQRQAAQARIRASEAVQADDEMSVPEADRLFAPPTPEQAAHTLRDLTWGEQLVVTRVSSARGPTLSYLYSLTEAAIFFSDEHPMSASTRSRGSFTMIDQGRFITWIRDVIGDVPLADVMERRLSRLDVYNDRVEELHRLFMLRMSQYARYLPEEDEADELAEVEPNE